MKGTDQRQNDRARKMLVFIDLPEGDLDDCGRGILSEASRLAERLDASWSVLCFAGAANDILQAMALYEVDHIVEIDTREPLADSLQVQGRAIAAAVEQLDVDVLLLAHNDLGGELAPMLAAELDAALFTEAIAYEQQEGCLQLTRLHLGQRVALVKSWSGSSRLVLTVSPKVLSGVVLPKMRCGKATVETLVTSVKGTSRASRIIERIAPDPQTVDVSEAEVMISAGMGCKAETFAQVEELSRLINASLGVTRPAYDIGYAGFERMIGQTGKTVAPRFYLALGISGSMHHIGGMKDSKHVVALNKDPKAAIFPNSDEGFVADLDEVLPLLINRLKSTPGGAS